MVEGVIGDFPGIGRMLRGEVRRVDFDPSMGLAALTGESVYPTLAHKGLAFLWGRRFRCQVRLSPEIPETAKHP